MRSVKIGSVTYECLLSLWHLAQCLKRSRHRHTENWQMSFWYIFSNSNFRFRHHLSSTLIKPSPCPLCISKLFKNDGKISCTSNMSCVLELYIFSWLCTDLGAKSNICHPVQVLFTFHGSSCEAEGTHLLHFSWSLQIPSIPLRLAEVFASVG